MSYNFKTPHIPVEMISFDDAVSGFVYIQQPFQLSILKQNKWHNPFAMQIFLEPTYFD